MKINYAGLFGLIFLILSLSECILAQSAENKAKPQISGSNSDTAINGSYRQMMGSKVANTKYGDVNIRIYTYVRYLNQLGLDTSYTNAFGQTSVIDRRQDIQIQKVSIYFSGWFLDPKFNYFLYVWTNNASQGQGAQVVVAGNLSYRFTKYLKLRAGIMSLPGVRTTEGNYPFWLSVDNRMIADEFFRPSYTSGIQAEGDITKKLSYKIMLGNNMSTLGVDAGQIDNGLNTLAASLVFCPTTGEYGIFNGSYGDFDNHQKAATRFGLHYTRSDEDRQGQPHTDAFENTTLRLSDGTSIFTPNIFSVGTQLEKARDRMTSFDAGLKYHGFALEGEYYWRWIDHFRVTGTPVTIDHLFDNGFQLLGSAMIIPRTLQLYTTYSEIFGEYGNPWETRAGINIFPFKKQEIRINAQYIYQYRGPVGGLAYPYQVGSTGSIFNLDLEFNF
jgi:hypothetical protein